MHRLAALIKCRLNVQANQEEPSHTHRTHRRREEKAGLLPACGQDLQRRMERIAGRRWWNACVRHDIIVRCLCVYVLCVSVCGCASSSGRINARWQWRQMLTHWIRCDWWHTRTYLPECIVWTGLGFRGRSGWQDMYAHMGVLPWRSICQR